MRKTLRRVMLASAISALSLGGVAVAMEPPDPTNPQQIQLRLNETRLGDIPGPKASALLRELRSKGHLTGEPAARLRTVVAGASHGKAARAGEVMLAVISGTQAQLRQGSKTSPGVEAFFTPAVDNGKISLAYRLSFRDPDQGIAGSRTVENRVTLATGELLAVRVLEPGTGAERIYWITASLPLSQ